MSELAAAFDALRSSLASSGVDFDLAAEDADEIAEEIRDLRLPNELVSAYAAAGPAADSSIPSVVEEMTLFSVRGLVAGQDGYRWNGPGRHRLPSWPDKWVAIASVFGDPFIADVTEEGFPVYFARHGAGAWEPHQVAPTMAAFVEGLAVFESVLMGEFRGDVWNEDGLRGAFKDRLHVRLADELDPAHVANFMRAVD